MNQENLQYKTNFIPNFYYIGATDEQVQRKNSAGWHKFVLNIGYIITGHCCLARLIVDIILCLIYHFALLFVLIIQKSLMC
jgi:hypothetical protein